MCSSHLLFHCHCLFQKSIGRWSNLAAAYLAKEAYWLSEKEQRHSLNTLLDDSFNLLQKMDIKKET